MSENFFIYFTAASLGVFLVKSIADGDKKWIIILSIASLLFGATLCAKEPKESLKEAALEAARGTADLAAGAYAARTNLGIATLSAASAAEHFSNSITHLKDAYKVYEERQERELEQRRLENTADFYTGDTIRQWDGN